MSKKQQIQNIRKDFPKGKIKKIYEISENYLIIKFIPNETLKYLRTFNEKYQTTNYYCLADIWSTGNERFLPPINCTSISQLLNKTYTLIT